jgi:hypothetical protein
MVQLTIEPTYERLPDAFEITRSAAIRAGEYRWTRYVVETETATKRRWVIWAALAGGGFYDGTRRQLAFSALLKPTTHLAFGLEGERNAISLPGARFTTSVMSARLDYNISPNASWTNLGQYDTDSRELAIQLRFRWILKPGSDAFLVVNRGWYRDDGASTGVCSTRTL